MFESDARAVAPVVVDAKNECLPIRSLNVTTNVVDAPTAPGKVDIM